MSTVFSGTIFHGLKRTLSGVLVDKSDGLDKNATYKKFCEVLSMEDQYEDVLETAGPGFASEKVEGSELATGTIQEGYLTRYTARTFGQKIIVTEEAMDDNKYPQILEAARRLKRSMYKTRELDAALMLVRAADTAYTYGDGLCLGNASNLLADGGTFSNILATPWSPSRAAVIAMRSQARSLPGHDGIREGYKLEKVLCPVEQEGVWQGIIESKNAPEPGAFNEINVVNRMGLELVPVLFWSNTTTNWAITTDAEGGLNWRDRKPITSRTWVDNDAMVMKYSVSARWSRGCSNKRGILFSFA